MKQLIISVFHSVPRVPRKKMERFGTPGSRVNLLHPAVRSFETTDEMPGNLAAIVLYINKQQCAKPHFAFNFPASSNLSIFSLLRSMIATSAMV